MSAREVIDALRGRGWMLATAESCTGGMIAAAITDEPGASSALDAVVGYSGVYDFRMGLDDRREAYLGGSPDDVPAAYDLASPVEQADMSMPPTLLCHGAEDDVVDPQQSAVLAETLDPLTTVDHRVLDGGHGFPFDGAHYEETYDLTADFLGTQLSTPGTDGLDRPDGY